MSEMQTKLNPKASPVAPTVDTVTTSPTAPSNMTFDKIDLSMPSNSDNEADDEREDAEMNTNTTSTLSQAILFDLPSNSEDETQDDDVDQSIVDLMEKAEQMYVIR